jgi:uncharacterized membrane protein YeaQ/YmgE (transglycosylase-associated protein family)
MNLGHRAQYDCEFSRAGTSHPPGPCDETALLRGKSFLRTRTAGQDSPMWHILWTIIIGFIAGIIAKFLHPGSNEPQGFILTTILGIVGAFVATYLGQAIGWYKAGAGAGLIGAVVGAVILLVIWGFFIAPKTSA